MKDCRLCGEPIQETARRCRHCQSFQDPADAPKQNFDLATLVISFVGIIATIGTIAAGIFGYFGFRTIGDINDRTKELSQRSTAALEAAQTRIKSFDDEVTKFKSALDQLETKATNARRELNGVAVTQRYEQFQRLLDNIQLDYANNFQTQIDELAKIATESAALQPIPDIETGYISEMKVLSQAVAEYRDAIKGNDKDGFKEIVAQIAAAPDRSLGKHRILTGCYSQLYNIAFQNGSNEASEYLSKQKYHANAAFKIAARLNRTATIAKHNYAATLVQSGDLLEMKRGYELLSEVSKEIPQTAGVWYNIAMYFAKTTKFDDALTNLERAKSLGDFATCDDVQQWDRDKQFDLLRQADVPEYKARIEKLRQVAGRTCTRPT